MGPSGPPLDNQTSARGNPRNSSDSLRKVGNFRIAKNQQNRSTSSGGVQRRAPPKAGLLQVLRVAFCFRDFEIIVFPRCSIDVRGLPPPPRGGAVAGEGGPEALLNDLV
jgi:hypothetical protein